MAKKAEKTLEERVEALEKAVNPMTRIVSKLKSWLETVHGADIDGDGKIGSFSIAGIVIVALISLMIMASGTLAQDIVNWYSNDTVYGTALISSDGAGTATVFADEFSGNLVSATGNGTVNTSALIDAAIADVTIGDNAARQTTMTLTDVPMVLGNGGPETNAFVGVKLFDFPEGRIYYYGATLAAASSSFTNSYNGSDVHYAVGTATAVGASSNTATRSDLIVDGLDDSWTNDTTTANSVLPVPAVFDGTSTAIAMYYNVILAETNISPTAITGTFSGTLKFNWAFLGDY